MLDSIRTEPGVAPASAPFSPSQISREALSSATTLTTMSACDAASFAELAIVAPLPASGAALSRFRLNTTSGKPAPTTRLAIPEPMIPKPRIATCGFAMASSFHWNCADQTLF